MERSAFRPALAPRSPAVAEISIRAAAASARFVLPSDRHYLAGRHVWARMENGIATVGVSAPLGEMLWFAPEVRFWVVERIEAGETLATVQGRSGRTVVIGSPVAGSVVAVNTLLERAPHALLAQPYGGGWVARIAPDRWEHDHAQMVSARGYRAALDAELPIGREFCFAGALLPGPLPG
jgi:glycine cleavage system H protein